MRACVYPGLFLHTHAYTQFALLYPLLVISHSSPPNTSTPLRRSPLSPAPPSFFSPSGVWEGYVNGQGGGLRKRREECERGERCCGVISESSYSLVRLAARCVSVCVCVCECECMYGVCLSGWWSLHIPVNKCIYVCVCVCAWGGMSVCYLMHVCFWCVNATFCVRLFKL